MNITLDIGEKINLKLKDNEVGKCCLNFQKKTRRIKQKLAIA